MKKFGKKIAAIAMASVMLLSMAGCGGKKSDDKKKDATPSDATTTTEASSSDAAGNFDISITEMSRIMGNGINLGNTMEATGRSKDAVAPSVKACETAWGAPETTQEMINGMKAAGFDTIRIPVGWANMMDYTHGDYTIAPELLDRVQTIVDWAIEADMYVIVNDHWDNQWWGMFGDADQSVRDSAWTMYETMWTQVTDRFKDYDEHLILESGNEELGSRFNDDWHGGSTQTGTLSEDECFDTANKVNQKFVDIVRASGSNNAKRFLLIAGYGTEIVKTLDDRWKVPTDTVDGKIFVSVHYYDPSDYCLFDGRSTWGSQDDFEEAKTTFAGLEKFTNAGYGVIIGEYGALPQWKNGACELKENAAIHNANVLNLCDLYNYVPVLWDTNGVFDRAAGEIRFEDMKDLYGSRNVAAQASMSDDELKEAAQAAYDDAYANADAGFVLDSNTAHAWIMYTSSDWSTQYVVGDTYDPTGANANIVSTECDITGEGTYTVSLDFTAVGGANACAFSAVGLANGETLFPGYAMDIKSFKINGEEVTMNGKPYTSSDDKVCTRVNLFNEWVSDKDIEKNLSKDDCNFRTADGDTTGITAMLFDGKGVGTVNTIEVTFDYVAPKQ